MQLKGVLLCLIDKQTKEYGITIMKKFLKYLIVSILSIVGLLGIAIVLSVTVFKDALIEFITKSQQEEMKSYYISELPVEPEQFAEDFKSIHDQVIEKCSLCKQKGYDMDSLYTTFSNRIGSEVQTKEDYGIMLNEYFAALKIGHAWPFFRGHAAQYHPTIAEDRIFISNPSEHLLHCGFCDKDEIIAINDVPIGQYVENKKRCTFASTEEYRLRKAQLGIFTSPTDTLITCSVRRDGKVLSLDLPLNCTMPIEESQAYHRIINDSVGYIYLESMMHTVVEDFKQAYEQVRHLPYLIVDNRYNSGGSSNNGRKIAEYLLCKKQKHCVSGNITPQPNAYTGKLFLLTSNKTISAAESFTLDLKESRLATLVGERTAGDTGCGPKVFTSKYGICFYIPTREAGVSPKGFPMEGMCIEPHHEVKQTVADFLDNKDTIIEYVLNELIG